MKLAQKIDIKFGRLSSIVSRRVPHTGSHKRAVDGEKRAFVRVLKTDWQDKATSSRGQSSKSLCYGEYRLQNSTIQEINYLEDGSRQRIGLIRDKVYEILNLYFKPRITEELIQYSRVISSLMADALVQSRPTMLIYTTKSNEMISDKDHKSVSLLPNSLLVQFFSKSILRIKLLSFLLNNILT